MSQIGTPDSMDDLLAEYHGHLPRGALLNETDVLLGAVLMELKAQRIAQSGPESAAVHLEQLRQTYGEGDDSRATYHSEEISAPKNEWTSVELDFTTSEIDLRNISGAIKVAFADPANEGNAIDYDQSDSPLAGIPVETSKVWVRGDGAARTLHLEAWS